MFNPHLRIRRQTKRGPVWFQEALFPCYLFAKFSPDELMQTVMTTHGVCNVVGFGQVIPVIPDEVIASLRTHFDEKEQHELREDLQPGDEIAITDGPFQGLNANVLRITKGTDRVQVLLTVLGRVVPVEVTRSQVVAQKPVASFLLKAGSN